MKDVFRMQAPAMGEERQIQFESDKAAFDGLNARQQRIAVFLAKNTFACRQWCVAANSVVMGAADWLYEKAVEAPWNAVKPQLEKAWQAAKKIFRGRKPPDPNSKLRKLWGRVKEKIAEGAKKAGHFLEYDCLLGLYRATKWAFDPRTKSGKPVFGNETVNKVVGTTMGLGALLVLSAWFGWLEIMSKVWHAQIAAAGVGSTAPMAARLARQLILHPAVTVGVAVGQFVVVPSIAAARHVIKSTGLAQGIAYQYNLRLREHRAEKAKLPQAPRRGWRPSGYVDRFFREIIEKSSPEYYRARIRKLEEKAREKLRRVMHRTPEPEQPAPAPTPAPPRVFAPGSFGAAKDFAAATAKPPESSPFPPPPAPKPAAPPPPAP